MGNLSIHERSVSWTRCYFKVFHSGAGEEALISTELTTGGGDKDFQADLHGGIRSTSMMSCNMQKSCTLSDGQG